MAVSSGQLGAAQRIIIQVDLLGDKAVVTGFQQMSAGATGFAAAQNRASASSARLTRHTWAQNQAMFTLRRTTFYTTMALGAMVATVGILGFRYQNTMQQIEVAVGPFLQRTGESIENVKNQLFLLGALTPLTFQEVGDAFRMMFIGLEGTNVTAAQTINTMKNLIDLLAAGGTLTQRSMRSLANAIQDMGYQGVLSSRIVTRLAFLGVPIREVLTKELGLTADQIANIKDQGITALQAMEAIDRFVARSKFSGAAFRLQQKTLVGAWTTFIDLVSQASGEGAAGPFEFIRKTFAGVNEELAKLYRTGRPVSFTAIAEAFDKQLSPKTHIILNLFVLLTTILKVVGAGFYGVFLAVQTLLRPISYLLNLVGAGTKAMELFGIVLGIVALALTMVLIRMIALGVWLGITTAATIISTITDYAAAAAKWVLNAAIAVYNALTKYSISLTVAALVVAAMMKAATIAQTIWTHKLTIAQWELNLAMLANPYVLIVAAIIALVAGFIILYFRWKAFHDLVDRTWRWLKEHPYVTFLIPFIGGLLVIIQHAQTIYGWFKKIYDIGVKVGNFFKRTFGWLFGGGGKGAGTPSPTTVRAVPRGPTVAPGITNVYMQRWGITPPRAQEGGSIVRGGSILVGDGGPEIVSLPAGAQITPLTHGAGGPLGWTMPDQNIKVILRVDGKDLAEVVAKHRQNVQARR